MKTIGDRHRGVRRGVRIQSGPSDLTKRQRKVLEQPTRKRIVEELEKRPGLNKNALAENLDLFANQVYMHLERLEEVGLVEMKHGPRDREVLVFRSQDTHLWENERTRILFGRRSTRQVGMYIAEHPGTNTKSIADALDLTPITIRHHLRKLRDSSLVATLQVGLDYEHHPSNELRAWTEDVGKHFARPWTAD